MASVSLKHVYKRFEGGVTAVSDFTLDIEDKEFVILVGPSGCGKTTTLRNGSRTRRGHRRRDLHR